ncbi:hypothetical protein L484_009654 [Morus notabilis]|uniref:WIT1/2 N-terminal helical bundle domain-containing protein n=1 Tax=Morus notabilis TaxID=981085 RepID=W9S2X5_9ROSA|nr:WPP domain-interacting tail-anchored protein 1 [Morus notabilis]XP_024024287.1 WPP domain-interacting tail-anchored protein 1 [Morus notabilis]EXB85808.1 hypothetical protein L484_009654 [Morus notabilis]
MDYDAVDEASVSVDHVNAHDQGADSGRPDFGDRISSNREVLGELRNSGEILTRLELDLACVSEKIVNLNVLMMHVATRENEFEAFALEKEHTLDDSLEKALEFDLLSGVLDSEVRGLDGFMAVLQSEIVNARELVSSCLHEGETLGEMEEKLCDSEQSFKQSQDQISEIRMQSLKLQRTLTCLDREEEWNNYKKLEEDQFFSVNAKIKMQTAEQQRHILRLLEKSLAREIDLEKKLVEFRHVEEELKQRLLSSQQEVYCMEDETADVWERWFEADSTSAVLMGISKELLGRLQILEFNLNSLVQQETKLRSKLEDSIEELKAKENSLNELASSSAEVSDLLVSQTNNLKASLREAEDKLILANSEAFTLSEKVALLEKQLKESDKVEFLERKLRESDIQLQRAIASAEASQEKQNLLHSTIDDMENLIVDLKGMVSKYESRADSAEEKCIILSESHAELNEELNFLRGRLESLEASLQQADETKLAAAKGVGLQTKVVANLVLQLAFERDRLHKQISSLAMENKILLLQLQGSNKDSAVLRHDMAAATCSKDSKEEVTETTSISSELDKTRENASFVENEVGATPGPETARRIDAGILNFKLVFLAMLILLIAVAAYYSSQLES